MSYFRPPMGDGPITSPTQIDDGNSIVVATVPPSRVECSALPPDSPWRKPGQVCATDFSLVDMVTGLFDKVRDVLGPSSTTTATSTAVADGPPVALIAAGVAVAAYFMFKKTKRT